MQKTLFNIEIILIIIYWAIHNFIIINTIRKKKDVHWYDRIFIGPHQTENYNLYKIICRINDEPLIWYRVSLVILFAIVFNLIAIGILF